MAVATCECQQVTMTGILPTASFVPAEAPKLRGVTINSRRPFCFCKNSRGTIEKKARAKSTIRGGVGPGTHTPLIG